MSQEVWAERAYHIFTGMLPGIRASFKAEDVRDRAEELGLPEPTDPRAWGGVMMRAKRAGLIELVGYTPSDSPQAHKRPTALWKAA